MGRRHHGGETGFGCRGPGGGGGAQHASQDRDDEVDTVR